MAAVEKVGRPLSLEARARRNLDPVEKRLQIAESLRIRAHPRLLLLGLEYSPRPALAVIEEIGAADPLRDEGRPDRTVERKPGLGHFGTLLQIEDIAGDFLIAEPGRQTPDRLSEPFDRPAALPDRRRRRF